jgi:glycosyltransferase involved in cell wall biosynthesis
MPFFSVIIPLFNKETFIENTLKSVLSQTFMDIEIIIINDGSTDSSEKKVKHFKDTRIRYYSKKNEGVSSTRNFGIEKALSSYICFIDADDYWYSNFLQEMFEVIHRYPKVKVFSAAIEVETPKTVFPANYSIKKTSDCEIVNYFEASYKESAIWTSCAVFDKTVFEKVGTFDIKLKNGEDIDLWIRIGLEYPILFLWKILARYIYDSNSLSKNKSYENTKIDFSRYTYIEKTNLPLKKFLDLNRFSLAIKSKIIGDKESFNLLYNAIDLKKLAIKKRILLLQPVFILKKLIFIKEALANLGLGNSIFK